MKFNFLSWDDKMLIGWVPFILSLIATYIYLRIDFKRYRQPLEEVKPDLHYTFSHHLKVVVIPKIKYVLRERVMPNRHNLH